jgi:Uma2 family endonuclease
MATVRTHIGPADNGRKMTLEEFRETDEEPGYVYELARGVVEVTEVPNDPHGQIVSNLQGAVHRYKDQHPGVIRRIGGGGEFRLWVPEMVSGRNPDVAIVFQGTPKDDRGRRRPALVAEVVSEGGEDRDYRMKREEYWTFGVREYWIVDPSLRQVLVLLRHGETWVERTYRGEDVVVSDLLPGFVGTVAELWADVDDED